MAPYISFSFAKTTDEESVEKRIIVREDDDFAKPKVKWSV